MKIKIRVVTNSVREEISTGADEFTARVKAPAHEGKANEALIKLVAAHFKVSRSDVRIVSGFTGKHKIVEIRKD